MIGTLPRAFWDEGLWTLRCLCVQERPGDGWLSHPYTASHEVVVGLKSDLLRARAGYKSSFSPTRPLV